MVERPGPQSTLAPRKAPRQERSEQTVAILLEAAAQVLEVDGLEGYNTNAVARRAGISIGSLYQYFPSKDALTVALMRRENAQFLYDGVKALQSVSGREAMERYIDAAVRQQLTRPRLARLLDIEESRPEIQREFGKSVSFRLLIERVLRRKDLPKQPRPRVAASDLLAIVRGLTDGAGERGETDLRALRRRVVAATFGYLHQMAHSPRPNASKSSSPRSARP